VKQPISGLVGVKPRMSEPKPDGGRAKEESHALDREYRIPRNQTLALKNMQAQMLLARARGELIERRLVQLQASFLLTAMRRQAFALPQAYCDRLAAPDDPLEANAILDEAMRGLLTEVADLPTRIGAAEWARFLADQTADNGAPPESEEKPAKAKRPRRRHDSPK
jgi:hypothetical protein